MCARPRDSASVRIAMEIAVVLWLLEASLRRRRCVARCECQVQVTGARDRGAALLRTRSKKRRASRNAARLVLPHVRLGGMHSTITMSARGWVACTRLADCGSRCRRALRPVIRVNSLRRCADLVRTVWTGCCCRLAPKQSVWPVSAMRVSRDGRGRRLLAARTGCASWKSYLVEGERGSLIDARCERRGYC